MRELQHFKTDKNGTKYYHDWNCPRCGGEGYNAGWRVYDSKCFACGGKGVSAKPRVVKEYTPEYKAKLDAKAEAKRAEKNEKLKAEGYLKKAKKYGFDENGVGYVYTGNTYEIKEQLRQGGAKFNVELHWISPRPIQGYECIEIAAADVFHFFEGYGWDLSYPKCKEWKQEHGLNW